MNAVLIVPEVGPGRASINRFLIFLDNEEVLDDVNCDNYVSELKSDHLTDRRGIAAVFTGIPFFRG